MGFELSYCPNGEDVLSRLRQLYETRSRDIVLAKMGIPSRTVAEFAQTHKAGYCDYPDIKKRVQFWDSYLKEQAGDVPIVCSAKFPDFCQALTDHTLPGGVFYDISGTPDVQTANKWMDLVRSYMP